MQSMIRRPDVIPVDSFDGVLFDLDDTLYREEEFVRSGFRAVAVHLSSHGFGKEDKIFGDLVRLHRSSPRRVFDRWGFPRGMTLSVSELVEIYRGHVPKLDVIPGVRQLLSSLKERGVRLGIVTDGIPDVQFRKVSALGLRDWIEHVICTGSQEIGFSKPHPAGLIHGAESLAVEGKKVVYVGDNASKDAKAAAAAGLPFVWARYAHGYYHHIIPTNATDVWYTVECVDELKRVLLPE